MCVFKAKIYDDWKMCVVLFFCHSIWCLCAIYHCREMCIIHILYVKKRWRFRLSIWTCIRRSLSLILSTAYIGDNRSRVKRKFHSLYLSSNNCAACDLLLVCRQMFIYILHLSFQFRFLFFSLSLFCPVDSIVFVRACTLFPI